MTRPTFFFLYLFLLLFSFARPAIGAVPPQQTIESRGSGR